MTGHNSVLLYCLQIMKNKRPASSVLLLCKMTEHMKWGVVCHANVSNKARNRRWRSKYFHLFAIKPFPIIKPTPLRKKNESLCINLEKSVKFNLCKAKVRKWGIPRRKWSRTGNVSKAKVCYNAVLLQMTMTAFLSTLS